MALDFDDLVLTPSLAAFGEVGVYTSPGSESFSLTGVFDNAYHEVDLLSGPPVSSLAPTFGTRLANFPVGIEPLQGDGITLRGVDYLVREVRPDGLGGVRLTLNLTR